MIDERLNHISDWLSHIFGTKKFKIEPASSDASFRRYFRVNHDGSSFIVMDAPPEHENTDSFITIAEFLFSHHIHVPEIIAKQEELGFLLLTDFGNVAYLDRLSIRTSDLLYKDALSSLIDIQRIPVSQIALPNYDGTMLQIELDLFPQWFLTTHLNVDLPNCLENVFTLLINNATDQPHVIVHRDYHSRNLMVTTEFPPGIIDFQDAVIGPITYDLVSLLRDCYISWPDEKLSQWIEYYFTAINKQGLIENISIDTFIKWFDLMGLQRHLKVLGIFCRLNYRDGKTHYMNDLKLTLEYVLKITARYPELTDFNQFLLNEPKVMAIL
jgi:aminoglycoside/choline kinase family phosphotransferase